MGNNETIALLFCCSGVLILSAMAALIYFIPKYYQQKRSLAQLQYRQTVLTASALDGLRLQWIQELPHHRYRNEIEVEVKFIYPLLRFLGYTANDLQIRVAVPIQVGRGIQNSTADWVILKNDHPCFIIEAKEDQQGLNDKVLGQARSYAYGLNLNRYVVTNGKTFQIWDRGTQNDKLTLHFQVGEIQQYWGKLKELIGKE